LNSRSDVLIIGGGVIGLAIARGLHKKGGRNITIIERGLIGREASWAAAGMLSPNVDADVGSDFHRFSRASLELYPGFAAELMDETGVDVELDRAGTISLAITDEERTALFAYVKNLRDAGCETEKLSAEEILKVEPRVSRNVKAGAYFPDDWQVENRNLLVALEKYARSYGIEIIENTVIDELVVKGGRVTGARSEATEFYAENTVLATGAWTSLIKFGGHEAPLKIRPIRGQMIMFDCGDRPLEKVIYGPRGYLVPRRDGRILVGSTSEDCGFVNRVTGDGIDRLQSVAIEALPILAEHKIAALWSGLRPCPPDELPVIGTVEDYEQLFVATGHYRNGILLAPLTAKITADALIADGHSEYLDTFSPNRFGGKIFRAPNVL